ncbi:TetR/AcrR family transcriptional regulator [Arthrobacter sp. NPDC058127]|uniref:TetR/AcrR family transcriptional regulator n=1 Tax=Arthrobacter sp. NPDC058127 TaxID=3346351 RepID=UPI0036E18AC7
MDETTPQRSTRSAHRRLAVVRAAASVLRRRGIDALTHRSVAEEARLPEATVRAFFSSREKLRSAALLYTLTGWVKRGEEFIVRLPLPLTLEQAAGAIVEVATIHPAEQAEMSRATISGVYERYIQSGRHPELRPLIARYNAELVDLVRRILALNGRIARPEIAQAVLAVVDGTVVYRLAAGDSPVPAAIAALRLTIPLLAPAAQNSERESR